MKIYCNFITKSVKDMAAKLLMHVSTVNNLISTWKTLNPTLGEPTIELIKSFILQEKALMDEYYLAIPYYELLKESPDGRLAQVHTDSSGMHTITLFYDTNKSNEYLDKFFNYIYGNNNSITSQLKKAVMSNLEKDGYTEKLLREIITTPKEALQFILWHEMAHIEFNHRKGYYTDAEEQYIKNKQYNKIDYLTPNKILIETDATRMAFMKARAYHKLHGTKKVNRDRIDKTFELINTWIKESSSHIEFVSDTHEYFIDGKKADSSVTQFIENYFGKKNIKGDYTHSLVIGTCVDLLARDFFSGEHDVRNTKYPNLSNTRRDAIINHLIRLKQYLDTDNRFKNGYLVITREFPIAALYDTPSGVKTIAGTMDMLVIDSTGKIHIFDFKVKNHPIDLTYNGLKVTDERDYTAQLNLYRTILESINPNIKVGSLQLIWFDTDYPKLSLALYKVNKDDEITIIEYDETNNRNVEILLEKHPKFVTPSLKPNVEKSIIGLTIRNSIANLIVPKMLRILFSNQAKLFGSDYNFKSNQNMKQTLVPGPDTKINIYAGTGENADLSNFAERPFDFREGYQDENSEAFKYFMDYHPFLPETFDSVEQAFQAFKWVHALISTDYAGEYLGYDTDERKDSESYKYGEKIDNQITKIVNAKTSAEAKRLGGQRGILNNNDVAWWDNHSSEIMKFLLKQSFRQNPQALQRLLATGNATLTHTQNKGKWGTEFPRLLMEVREELRRENPQIGNSYDNQDIVNQLIDQLKASGITVLGRVDMEKYLKNHPNDIRMFIGKKARNQFEQQLMKARPDMATPKYTVDGINFIKDPFSDDFIPNRLDAVTVQRLQKEGVIKEGVFAAWALTDKGKEMAQVSHPEIDATLDFLHSLEDSKENTVYIKTAIRWITNRSLTLPQDHEKAYQAFELARKKHLDLQKYNTLGELITSPEMQPKRRGKKDFDPDKATTFSNKRTVTTEGGRVFTVYDVENTDEGQREVCKALAAHYEMSPWCLSTFTATGEPTASAKRYWDDYNAIPRKIAYENGKPVAFSSDSEIVDIPSIKGTLNGAEFIRVSKDVAYAWDEDSIPPKEKNRLITDKLAYIENNHLWLTEKGISQADFGPNDPFEKLNNSNREAWWDMEDRHPQDTLSDSIVSEPRKQPNMEEEDPAMAEYLRQEHAQQEQQALDDMMEAWDRMTPEERAQEEENFWYEDFPFFITPEGEIYGFVDKEGNIYLDETVIDVEHPMHEYTHLWDKIVIKNNPELWRQGVKLLQQTSLWNEIVDDANYGGKWRSLLEDNKITNEQYNNLIASEVHARLVGQNSKQVIEELARKDSKNLIDKIKNWLLAFWKDLKSTFSNWSSKELSELTLELFNTMPIRDFTEMTLKEYLNSQTKSQLSVTESTGDYAQRTKENAEWSDVTLAFAVDFNTAGEKLTKRVAGNKYHAFSIANIKGTSGINNQSYITTGFMSGKRWASVQQIKEKFPKGLKINIAGNGIYTLLPKGISQEDVNDYIEGFLDGARQEGVIISEVRSGGQTGADEAGIIAAQRLGIKASIHAPKGFKFRGKDGKDISDKERFLARFNSRNQDLVLNTQPDIQELTPVKSMGASLLQQQQQSEAVKQTEQEKIKVPNIGVEKENFSVNKESVVAKLARTFTPLERTMRVETIARMFSAEIGLELNNLIEQKTLELSQATNLDDIQLIQQELNKLRDPEIGRKTVLESIPLINIFEKIKNNFEINLNTPDEELIEDFGERIGSKLKENSKKIIDNFYPLVNEALSLIEHWEDIRIVAEEHDYNTGNGKKKVISGNVAETAAEENSDTFEDDEASKRVTGNDGWSYKVRLIDPHVTFSKRIKRMLSNVVLEGPNGIEHDDMGNVRFLNSQTTYMILMDKLSTLKSPDEFAYKDNNGNYHFPALEKMKVRYPWVNQIISNLNIDSSLVASFYTCFRKDYIPYWMQFFDTKSQQWKTYQLNAPMALDSTITDVTRNYELGIALVEDSVYNQHELSKENASKGIGIINNIEGIIQEFTEDDYPNILEAVTYTLRMIGFNVYENDVASILNGDESVTNINFIISNTKNILDNIASGKTSDEDHLILRNDEYYKNIGNIIGTVTDLSNMNSFRQGDKTLYSYSAPNFINTLIKNLKSDNALKYINDNYRYEFFMDGDNYRGWIKDLANDEELRHQLQLKELKYIGNKEYSKWNKNDITLHFIMEYYSIPRNTSTPKQYAWFGFPILADSEVALFIKFTKEEGVGYEDRIIAKLRDVALQELYRINLVKRRRSLIEKGKIQEINNFDKNGDRFHFFPELNYYLDSILNATTEESRIKIIDKALRNIMDNSFTDFLNDASSVKDAITDFLEHGNIISNKNEYEEAVKEYFYNSVYAKSQIIQLTTTDLAFYKNDVDFQKRFKEIYAAGDKLFTNSDYGKKFRRVLYLKDEKSTSSSYSLLKKTLEEARREKRIQSYDVDNILYKFRDITGTDAQALISPNAFRSVLDMMGKWTPEMEDALQAFKNGTWTMKEFNTVWQTIKPFVYTQIPKPDGFGGTIKVPHQNKNSEFLLLAAFSTIADALNKSPKLRAIADFMDKHDIDVVQFESAVKVGGQGVISIEDEGFKKWLSKNNSIDASIKTLKDFKEHNDRLLGTGTITQEEYNRRIQDVQPSYEDTISILEDSILDINGKENPEVVHIIPYDDYVVQQPTPEHLFDTEAIFGSQFRNLIISDLPEDFSIVINGVTLNKNQISRLYQASITENLLSAYSKLKEKFTDIETLQSDLIRSIKSNSNYDRDLINALEIVEITDDDGKTRKIFNIPLNNPSTTEELQKLILSKFRNNIVRQQIKGGNCILVSDYGLTKELNIVYNEEGNKKSGIKYIECYLPAHSMEFMEAIAEKNADGTFILNPRNLPDKLRRAIGYRIPTEGKYSMAPLMIKGFLPHQNGSTIMLPAEITTIAGSDFDVDKMFMFFYAFKVYKYNMSDAKKAYERTIGRISNSLQSIFKTNKLENVDSIYDAIMDSTIDDKEFKEWFNKHKEQYRYKRPKLVDIKYDINKAINDAKYLSSISKEARDNLLIDISYGILTSPEMASRVLHPGNFDKLKIMSCISVILNDTQLLEKFNKDNKYNNEEETIEGIINIINKGDVDSISDFVKDNKRIKNTLLPQTFSYFHNQNMTGGALIGVYANNTTAQAKFQYSKLSLSSLFTFIINGNPIKSLHDIVSKRGELISENCAQFSAASVDNVKDPVLANLMQNLNTANIAGTLARLGLSCDEIALLFIQPVIKEIIEYTGGLPNKFILDSIEDLNKLLIDKGERPFDEKTVRIHNFTSEELLESCIIYANRMSDRISDKEQIKYLRNQLMVLYLFKDCILPISRDVSTLTRLSRADSTKGTIKPYLASALARRFLLKRFLNKKGEKTFTLWDMQGILDSKISTNMSIDELRDIFLKSNMSMLQAFHSLGIDAAIELSEKYFPQVSKYAIDILDELLDNAPDSLFGNVSNLENFITTFLNEMTTFCLTSSDFFGNDALETLEEKRDFYLYKYPSIFLESILSNKEVQELACIRKLDVVNGEIVMIKSGRMTPMSKETIKNAFDQLLYMDGEITRDGKVKPVQQLAIDLFMYSFYKDNLKFGPNSFGNFFSTTFMTSFPKFISKLRNMEIEADNNAFNYFSKYPEQFVANNYYYCIPEINVSEDDIKYGRVIKREGNLIIKSALVYNRNGHIKLSNGSEMKGSYERILVDDQLYRITDESRLNVGFVTYIPAPMNKDISMKKYNALASDSFEVMEYTTSENLVKASKSINSNSVLIDSIQAEQEMSVANPDEYDYSMESLLTAMEGGYYTQEFEGMNLPDNYSPEDGQLLLDNLMCIEPPK